MEINPKELFGSWSLFFCSVSSSLRLLEAGLVRASVGAEGRALPKLATLQIVIGELKKNDLCSRSFASLCYCYISLSS